MEDQVRNDIPGPHEVTHEQWAQMTPEERAHAGDASRYPDVGPPVETTPEEMSSNGMA